MNFYTQQQFKPKVSVLVPAYNAMKFLPETITSILNQTYQDFEIIIVNDGSSDCIETWVKQLSDERIQLVSQSNQGLASARNKGLIEARGEYIAFIDADDLWLPTKLEKQVQILDNNQDTGLVYTWIALIDEHSKPQGKLRKNYAQGNVWLELTTHNIVECGSVALVRRECFEKVGLFDIDLPFSCSEDWDMWLRIAADYKFGLVKEPLVYYRCHSNNLSSRWQTMDKSFQIVLKKAFDSAPKSLQSYKNRSYGFAKLITAWKALQNSNGDLKAAIKNEQEAIQYYPKIKYTKEYLRFRVAFLFIRLFGLQPYNNFRQSIYRLKVKSTRFLKGI
ncbi:glycosyltransferase [Myxosarcina sp. GI1]|uniref:glycosyltransferase family 2 protein n=1 Tax=Myxosarcina sp. GI1 TaxID=1541065 RepID=UPI00055AF44E|nr:glycosyltransferase [Myxosarcina sp. GI1]